MSDMTPDQVIAQIDEWRDHEVRYEVLGGAVTNHNYLVTVDGEPGSPAWASSSCASRARAARASSTASASNATTWRRRRQV